MLRSVSLTPTVVHGGARLAELKALQPSWHKVFAAASRDQAWMNEVFGPMAEKCAWTAQEMAVYNRVHARLLEKPTLLLPNAVYLKTGPDDFALGVCNVQAGEPYQVQLVHDYQAASVVKGQLEAGPLAAVTETLAKAARMVHPTQPVVAILSKPTTTLALRTKADVVGVAARLKAVEGVPTVLYVSMADLATATLDKDNHLVFQGHKISVIYSRYDFSHPSGSFVKRAHDHSSSSSSSGIVEAADSSSPADPAKWAGEWAAVERMEQSTCILSSSIASRLANRRGVLYALANSPGAIERFLSDSPHKSSSNARSADGSTPSSSSSSNDSSNSGQSSIAAEAAAFRALLPEQWALGDEVASSSSSSSLRNQASEVKALQDMVEANPDAFVAKNVLRPRTGSDKTQNRLASGGALVEDPSGLRALFEINKSTGELAGKHHVLYRKIGLEQHDASIAHDGEVYSLERDNHGGATSEVCTYGAYLADAQNNVLESREIGVGVRTKPADLNHPLTKALGYGAVGCCLVVPHA